MPTGSRVDKSREPPGALSVSQLTAIIKETLEGTFPDVWVAGGDEWWFDVREGDRMDLLPESRRYEPGQRARFQVRMPFRQATALITVEREGIAET